MASSFILAAVRTPIGKLLGGLSGLSAPQLGAAAIREAVRRAGIDPRRLDEVILGQVLQGGAGQAPARHAALLAELPPEIPAVTVNKVCGSGLKAVMLADQAIRCGDAAAVVAGGMESMSQSPHALLRSRTGCKYGSQELVDLMIHDGLRCAWERETMGELAERMVQELGIERSQQDALAAESHRRAVRARDEGLFAAEVVPVVTPGGAAVHCDEGPRPGTTAEGLARLPPAFAPNGSITAGNSSQISDGAAAVVVVDESLAASSHVPWRARIVASAASGVEPRQLYLAPVVAIERVLARARLSPAEIDLVELNEAFAAQCVACLRRLAWDPERVNVHGGAIALGHPIGASGVRGLVTLIHALRQRRLRRGLVSLCLGGGNAVALIVELDA